MDCESLSKMARALGKEAEASCYEQKMREMTDRINTMMWCEEDGCYYNLKFDGSFSRRQSPDCFMPLMTGQVPEDRKNKLLQILKDEKKFWGEYMIPSIARMIQLFPNSTTGEDRSGRPRHSGHIWP